MQIYRTGSPGVKLFIPTQPLLGVLNKVSYGVFAY